MGWKPPNHKPLNWYSKQPKSQDNPSGQGHEVREGGKVPIWVYIEKVHEDKFGIGYKQAIVKYKNAVLGKLIVSPEGRFVAITSTRYELIPNEVVRAKLLKLGYEVVYEDDVTLVMAKSFGNRTVYVVNAMDGSHALKIVIRSLNVMVPVVSRKHYKSVNEVVENLEGLVNDALEWFSKVEQYVVKVLEEPVGEAFVQSLKEYQGLPGYVKRAMLSAYYRVAGIYQTIKQPVPAIHLYRAGIQAILGRQGLSWDGKLNLVRELNKLFGVLDLLEKLTQ